MESSVLLSFCVMENVIFLFRNESYLFVYIAFTSMLKYFQQVLILI